MLVTVEDRFGNVVRTLSPAARQQPGHVELAWNGRNQRGRVVPSGVYRISVDATNRLGTAIAIGIDGFPLIAYHDEGSGDLKVMHLTNQIGIPYLRLR